ncbi:MAG: DHHA1 domain-containing protein [Candidatus Methanomethylophilaceae archaeon]
MTVKLYKRDPYMFEFEATVTATDGDWVALDVSAFYPGGGGQGKDTGTVQGLPVHDLRAKDDVLWHLIPGSPLQPGTRVWCSVDWERRYQLMRAHTAEHMLFSALQRQRPEMELVKISLEEGQKQLIVRGDLDWDLLLTVQDEVNQAVRENLSVLRSCLHRDDLDPDEVRVKMERIEGDEISVVEVGQDRVACSGIHVMETGEIEAFLIIRMASAGKDGTAIEFLVGEEATATALALANHALQAAEALGSRVEDLPKSARNAKERSESQRRALKQYARQALDALPLQEVGDIKVRSGVLPMADRAELSEAAESIRSNGEVAVLLSVDDGISVVLAAPEDSSLDCKRLLQESLAPLGGRGGGKHCFSQGGVSRCDCAREILQSIMDGIRLS